jgi:hypothetical protein
MRRSFPFSAQGKIMGQKPLVCILRCLTGFAGLVVINFALRLMLPGEGSLLHDIPLWSQSSPFYDLGLFLQFTLLGLWASAGAPMIFQRMRLA